MRHRRDRIGAVVEVDPRRVQIAIPSDFAMPEGGLNIRWPDGFLEQEARLLDYKVYAALAYCRANKLDRIAGNSPQARLGIITTGKSFATPCRRSPTSVSTRAFARESGIRLYKVAMSWPLEPQGARKFAEGLEEILVVEEKRQVIDTRSRRSSTTGEKACVRRACRQVRRQRRMSIAEGQPAGNWLLPAHYELSPALIAKGWRIVSQSLGLTRGWRPLPRAACLPRIQGKSLAKRASWQSLALFLRRCPHNTSTKVPEGSRAMAGIGCHFMRCGWTATPPPSRIWRRKARLDRASAFHRMPARFRQHRRRHLFPFRAARDPRRRGFPV